MLPRARTACLLELVFAPVDKELGQPIDYLRRRGILQIAETAHDVEPDFTFGFIQILEKRRGGGFLTDVAPRR